MKGETKCKKRKEEKKKLKKQGCERRSKIRGEGRGSGVLDK